MYTLSFSGTRYCTLNQIERLTEARVDTLFDQYERFVTGGCLGFDAYIGLLLAIRFPEKHHVVIVPADRRQIDPWWESHEIQQMIQLEILDPANLEIRFMAEGSSYRRRNVELVREASDRLYYCAQFPEGHKRSRRSGTWQTVRLARKAELITDGLELMAE